MAHDVFVSYATEDKNVADATCHHLEKAGVRCWIAPRDVRPGSPWPSEIAAAIDACRVFVLILSRSCNESQQTLREVTIAVDAGKHIFPVRIHDVTPSQSLRYLLSVPHWMDAMNPPLEAHLNRLADSVRTALGMSQGDAPPPPPPSPAKSRRPLLIGLGLAAAAGLAVAGVIVVPGWLKPERGPISSTLSDSDTPGAATPKEPAPPQPAPDAAPSADLEYVNAQWHAWYGSLVGERDVIRSSFADDPALIALLDTLNADAAHRESADDLAKLPAAGRDARAKAHRAYIDSVAAVLNEKWEPRDRLASLAIICDQAKWTALGKHAAEIAESLRQAQRGGPPVGSMKLWLESVRDERRTLDELDRVVTRCASDAEQIDALGPGVSAALIARMRSTLDLVAFTGKSDSTLTLAKSHAELVARLWEAANNSMPLVDAKTWLDNPHVRKFSSDEPIEHSDFEALLTDLRSPDYLLERTTTRDIVLAPLAMLKSQDGDVVPPAGLSEPDALRFAAARREIRQLLDDKAKLHRDKRPWTQANAASLKRDVDAWVARATEQQNTINALIAKPPTPPPQQPDPSPPDSKPPAPAATDTSLLARLAGRTLLSVWVYDQRAHREYWTMQFGEVRNGTANVVIAGRTSDTLTATAKADHVAMTVPNYPRSRDKTWTGDLDFAAVKPADEPIVLSGLAAPIIYKSAAPKGDWYLVEVPPGVSPVSTLPGVRVSRSSDDLVAGGRVPIDPLGANSSLRVGVAMLAKDGPIRLRGEFLRFDSRARDRNDATIKITADGNTLWTAPVGATRIIPVDVTIPKGAQQVELSVDRCPDPVIWNALRFEPPAPAPPR